MRRLGRYLWLVLLLGAVSGCAHDVDYLYNATYDVADINIESRYIELFGDHSADFTIEDTEDPEESTTVVITQSSVYNLKFTITAVETVGGNTRLVVAEDLSDNLHDILSVDPAELYFEIQGNQVTKFNNVKTLHVKGAGDNDGLFTLDEVVQEGDNTRLTVDEAIPSAVAAGTLQSADYGILQQGQADQLVPDPSSLRLRFVTEQNLSPSFWYYMVFNFTKAPASYNATVTEDQRPYDEISGIDRGRNWELYTAVHVDGSGGEEAYCLQRPRLPSVLNTAHGPVDVTTGYFNDGISYQDGELVPVADSVIDVAVACKTDNLVQLIRGITPSLNPSEVAYYLEPAVIAESRGSGLVAPIRVYAGELTGDQNTDLLILYQGDANPNNPVPAVLRVLAGDGAGNFSTLTPDTQLAGTPVDWAVGNFNEDNISDVAVLTTSTTANQVELYLRGDVSTGEEDPLIDYVAGEVLPVGENPIAIAAGALEGSVLDIVVVDKGSDTDDPDPASEDEVANPDYVDVVRPFINSGLGVFEAAQIQLLPGEITGVATGALKGTKDDIVVSYFPLEGGIRKTEEGTQNPLGSVAAFFVEGDIAEIETTVPTVTFTGDPRDLLVHNTDGTQGSYPSVVAVDGKPDAGPGDDNQTMYILRTGREGTEFVWNTELIIYLTGGHEPSSIHLADLNRDGEATDLVIADSADSTGGNRVSLFYSLSKQKPTESTGTFYHETRNNFSSADIYWTDDEPQMLTSQEWYLDHTVGPNFFELVIDPLLFYDLARLPPDTVMVEFMTGTTAIEYLLNEDQFGLIRDRLIEPVVVEIEVNHNEYEQISPKVGVDIDDAAANIIDWIVEVL